MKKRAVGFVLLLLSLIGVQFLISGCSHKVIEHASIENVSLHSEWTLIKKEVGRNIADAGLVEIRLEADQDRRVILYSWQWVETVNGVNTHYYADKKTDKYIITSAQDTFALHQKPISIETAINAVDRYGLNKIFNNNSMANLVLRQAIESKFSVINGKHVLIEGNAEIEESHVSTGKSYIVGLYAVTNGSRQYLFGVE